MSFAARGAALAAAGWLALAAPAPAAEFSPALTELITQAGQDGALSLMFGEGALGGSRGAKLFEKEMGETFGTRIKITFTPGPSMPAMGSQIAALYSAKHVSPTDIFVGWSRHMAGLARYEIFAAADWEKLLPGRLTSEIVEGNGTMLKAVTSLPGMYYNPKLAPYRPERLTDFLKPEWTGKIASTPYAANFDVLAGRDLWGPERAIDYARKLSAQIAGIIRCDEGVRIASGEFIALVPNCSARDAEAAIEAGAPIANVYPLDFRVINFTYIAVPKNAPHPSAAKLFAVFAMMPAGQKIIRDTWGSDLHLFPETQSHKEIAALQAESGGTLKSVDVAWQIANTEGNQAWGEIQKILATRP